MARPGRTPFKDRKRDRTYKEIVEWGRQKPWGTMLVLPHRYSETAIKKHARLIWAEARYQGLGRKVHETRNADGTWTLSFQLWDIATSRAYVADRARRTGELPYNSRRKKP